MPTYKITYLDESEYQTELTCSPETLDEEIQREVLSGDRDRASTSWVDVRVTDEDGNDWRQTFTIPAAEPKCRRGLEHSWQSPHEIVGGIKENPGVWGKGGGVTIHEVCLHCGAHRHTDTWAQRSDTGEQGLLSYSYEPADEISLAWVREMREADRREPLNNETDRVNDAIARSISHNEIVKLPWSQAAHDALRAVCEDWIDTRDHRGVQFWGSDEGDEWRVHLIRGADTTEA